jgi:hypothetical protein
MRPHLGRSAQHRLHDPVVGATTAEIAVKCGAHLGIVRGGISHQQRGRAHQNSGNTIAALQGLLGDKGPLQRMRVLRISQPLRRRDLLVRNRPQWGVASGYCMITDNDIAGATLIGAAPEVRSSHLEAPTQNGEQ